VNPLVFQPISHLAVGSGRFIASIRRRPRLQGMHSEPTSQHLFVQRSRHSDEAASSTSDEVTRPRHEPRVTTQSDDAEQVRTAVREQYGQIARSGGGCAANCCTPGGSERASLSLGYSDEDLANVPDGANLGLGCGNPHAIAALRNGETVLDLGSGAGFDCFLAARRVGPEGQVIGVDMTPDMVSMARANASRSGLDNVEFRLGEIERLPVRDASVDVILSNCVINLSPDKAAVFAEAFRVLEPGGRLAISDVVVTAPLPASVRDDVSALTGCVAGAASVDELEQVLADAGFVEIRVVVDTQSREFISEWMPGSGIESFVASASIEANKPGVSKLDASACCAPSCCTKDAT